MTESERLADVERVLRQADDELARDLAARTDVDGMLVRVKRRAHAAPGGERARASGIPGTVPAHGGEPGASAAQGAQEMGALLLADESSVEPGSPLLGESDPHRRSARTVPAAEALSARVLAGAGDLLRALAAPMRLAIVLELRDADRCVHELVDALGVAQPLIGQHLRILKAAGVVHGERRGREVVYRLADEHLAHIVTDAIAHLQERR